MTKTLNFRVDESVSYDRQVTLANLATVILYDDDNYDDDDDNHDDDTDNYDQLDLTMADMTMITLATLAQELDTYSAAVRQRFLHIIPSPTVTYCHILPNHPTQHHLNGGLWQQGGRQDAINAINLRYICNIFAVCS